MAYKEELILNDLSSRGESILDAAKRLFLKHGYDQTSLEMIIAEAGGSRRSIYNEFGNKQGLLTSVIQQQIVIHTATIASIKLSQLAPKDALKEVCFRFLKGILSDTLVSLFRLVLQVVPKLPEVGTLIYEKGPLKGMEPLTDYLIELDKNGVLSIDDPLFATQILIEMVKGRLHFKMLLLPNDKLLDEDVYEHVDKAVDLFFKAYQPSL
ncbi:TetR/AcrR family transcriptional regulator [Colwellia sp. 4_MG-2023]|jgi:TetR/AcrR family transcriptional repressor of mexJK operon|uniref:TetR/AcrR family transcriptional regulator n=1 Tax=unclassified Colwellia TaxID=196834 RepID=UPI001C08DF3B|nr:MULTISPECIES: TetR/AcrR family transcriptional regulator [unclassified Colwellia]MBU2925575.1 TetR/AcrR family transcriptional regulator [Colwellia sp. C2M11]MDO6508393.1 TetR/AcrR family transcriptional regulator [Colwellia sp. 5_MG-2023]MDO6557009.1 TetR/AcrR family transcriptional regulator [Colwellia sp. 4_MG-2023]MDO6651456.1 TetR/AcrR family transcriptional regulator [Colwellia sp. 3_MG-2023]MDO6666811.1 TetR/AcrR family transcriptional regulator [Colwellia sp. 2_MG-2023]